jgi:membrane protease YdiL (CAAX protease family)
MRKLSAILKWFLFVFLGFIISGFIGVFLNYLNLIPNIFGKTGTLVSQQINDLWWLLPLLALAPLVFRYHVSWLGDQKRAWLLVAPMFIYALTNLYTDGIFWNRLTVIYLVGSFIVGFTEEYLFRGTLMDALMKVNVGTTGVVWISAVIFSLFHMLNALATGNVVAIAFQLILTLGWGVFQGAIYVKTKSLLPLAITHGLYDFSVLAPGHAVVNFGGIVDNLVPAAVLLVLGLVYLKKVSTK